MSNFKQISVDSSSFIATIGPGNRLGDVALGLNNAGRALPHGTCPYVGIGGHSGRSLNIQVSIFIYFSPSRRLWRVWIHLKKMGVNLGHDSISGSCFGKWNHCHCLRNQLS